jgi:hypothetical protein
MDVFDSYFRTLRIFLPRDQREDIIRELSEEVRSQVAEKEATLKRPLNAEEQAAILGHYGHPLVTAARYRREQYLIGPVVFPYYWIVVKLVVGLIALGHAIGAAVLLASGATWDQMAAVLNDTVATALKALGWITALAAWMELWLSRTRALEKWKPSVSAVAGVARKAVRPWASVGSHEPTIVAFVIGIVVSAWWLAGLRLPYLFFGPGAVNLEWGPAMDRVFPVLVVAQLMLLVNQLIRLLDFETTRTLRITKAVWLIAGWALIYLVATSDHQWMVWRGDAAARAATTFLHVAGRDISLIQFVNYVWSTIFVFVASMGVWTTVRAVLRRIRRPPRHAFA